MFKQNSDRQLEDNSLTEEASCEDLDDFDFEFDEHFEAESADEWKIIDDPFPEEIALKAAYFPDETD